MLAGWIPGPALALAIVVGVEGTWRSAWRQWLPRLVVLGVATLAASGSWMLIVDSWPAQDHPFVGGSTDNSVYNLAFGYNGFYRVEGDTDNTTPVDQLTRLNPPSATSLDENRGPGLLRMFDDEHGGGIAWLLPFSLVGGFASLWRWRSYRVQRAGVALWLGWALLFAGVFSFTSGTYHPYYTAALAPAIGALAGISAISLSQLAASNRGWLLAGGLLAVLTLLLQLEISGRHEDFYAWLRPFLVLTVTAGLALLAASAWKPTVPVPAGLVVVLGGLILMPGAWALHETAHATSNPISPRAGPRMVAEVSPLQQPASPEATLEMVSFLESRREQDTVWDLVVPNARDASMLMVTYDLSVMALGGFRGTDPTLTPAEFAQFVRAGEVSFVLVTDRPGTQAAAPSEFDEPKAGVEAVFEAVESHCEVASEAIRPIRVIEQGFIYNCAGHADELESSAK